ncbi:retrovirus-related Pol polyprotein from transposon 297 [Trichonephila clavipes]|nr:retrovirus-related Pol polyprotein from transposon 297 [Trichonephila clavipes]
MKEVAEESMKMAAVKEYSSSPDNLLTVSGDGTWKTRGHSSFIDTDDEPMHWFCPTNPNTWCKYNAAINNNLQNYKHKPSVAKAVRDVIKPVFADLSHPALLKKCLGGIAGYYQKYINLFSVIAAPLTDALKGRAKKGEIKWTTECENAFRELKGKLIDKPALYAPNFEREFIVQTDASNAGMGAVLTQLTEQGEEHPILYLSKKFSEVEKRYCTTEKECASIVFAIKRLHYYLDGNSFLVMTDHNPLVWLNRNVSSNPRLMRWALALQPYNFRIVHRSVKVTKMQIVSADR